ncbi:DUF4238 domain-containing protein [Pseudarthrobacter sp. YS3]|uniref:DUF4238 domain-containing protein n=1 Tax=Pseudarthrobacter sp. YS3 TaxID=3453718 RepID=UPI003EE83DB3
MQIRRRVSPTPCRGCTHSCRSATFWGGGNSGSAPLGVRTRAIELCTIYLMSMPLSRDHHVVPQFYLRGFADDQRRVRQMSRAERAGLQVAVKRATVEADFYNIRDGEDAFHDDWELLLGRIESNAAPVFHNVVHGTWPLADNEREKLVDWIAAQYLRTPAFRFVLDHSLEEWRVEIEQGGIDAMRAVVKNQELSDDQVLQLWEQSNEPHPRGAYQPTYVQLVWFIGMLPQVAKALYERAWTLVRFPEPALLTADNAVVSVDDREEIHPLAPGAKVVQIALDRQNLLQMIISDRHDDTDLTGTPEMAHMANALVVHNADRFVFEHPGDGLAEWLWDIPE